MKKKRGVVEPFKSHPESLMIVPTEIFLVEAPKWYLTHAAMVSLGWSEDDIAEYTKKAQRDVN
jgi:hypothetical protein